MDIRSDIMTTDYARASLVLVKGKWYAQVTIPQPLRAAFNGRVQERKSTGTSDRKDAERRLHSLAAEIYAKFDKARESTHPLVVAANILQRQLNGGINWHDYQWFSENFQQAVDDVRGRALQVLHYPVPESDPEDAIAISRHQSQVEDEFVAFEEEVQKFRSGKPVAAPTLSEAAEACFGSQTFQRKKTETVYRRAVGRFIELFGDLSVTEIDRQSAVRFVEHLDKDLAASTLQRDVGTLQRVMRYCEEREWVSSNPFVQVRLKGKGQPPKSRRPFSRSQLERLFATEMSSRDRLCLSILAATGMRLDEAALLEWDDVRTEGGIRYFDLTRMNKLVKNERSAREIPVPRALKLPSPGKGRLFNYRIDADGKAENAASKALMRHIRPLREDPTDKRLTVHSLRHTYKDLLRDAGVPMDVQEFIMGHAGTNVGSRYGSGLSLAKKAKHMEEVDLSFLR